LPFFIGEPGGGYGILSGEVARLRMERGSHAPVEGESGGCDGE